MNSTTYLRSAFLLMALAVVTGAFGAHALKERLEEGSLETWKTAVLYHFIHAAGILILQIASRAFGLNEKRIRLASGIMLAGIVLFSGSIYLLSTRSLSGLEIAWLGPVTPIGGLCFIAGWVLAAMSFGSIVKSKA